MPKVSPTSLGPEARYQNLALFEAESAYSLRQTIAELVSRNAVQSTTIKKLSKTITDGQADTAAAGKLRQRLATLSRDKDSDRLESAALQNVRPSFKVTPPRLARACCAARAVRAVQPPDRVVRKLVLRGLPLFPGPLPRPPSALRVASPLASL